MLRWRLQVYVPPLRRSALMRCRGNRRATTTWASPFGVERQRKGPWESKRPADPPVAWPRGAAEGRTRRKAKGRRGSLRLGDASTLVRRRHLSHHSCASPERSPQRRRLPAAVWAASASNSHMYAKEAIDSRSIDLCAQANQHHPISLGFAFLLSTR